LRQAILLVEAAQKGNKSAIDLMLGDQHGKFSGNLPRGIPHQKPDLLVKKTVVHRHDTLFAHVNLNPF
jgi:hypothetical protein